MSRSRISLLSCTALLGLGMMFGPKPAAANDELIKLQGDANQWVMPTGNYANHRYSTLDKINASNVGKLHPVWSFSTGVFTWP